MKHTIALLTIGLTLANAAPISPNPLSASDVRSPLPVDKRQPEEARSLLARAISMLLGDHVQSRSLSKRWDPFPGEWGFISSQPETPAGFEGNLNPNIPVGEVPGAIGSNMDPRRIRRRRDNDDSDKKQSKSSTIQKQESDASRVTNRQADITDGSAGEDGSGDDDGSTDEDGSIGAGSALGTADIAPNDGAAMAAADAALQSGTTPPTVTIFDKRESMIDGGGGDDGGAFGTGSATWTATQGVPYDGEGDGPSVFNREETVEASA